MISSIKEGPLKISSFPKCPKEKDYGRIRTELTITDMLYEMILDESLLEEMISRCCPQIEIALSGWMPIWLFSNIVFLLLTFSLYQLQLR